MRLKYQCTKSWLQLFGSSNVLADNINVHFTSFSTSALFKTYPKLEPQPFIPQNRSAFSFLFALITSPDAVTNSKNL